MVLRVLYTISLLLSICYLFRIYVMFVCMKLCMCWCLRVVLLLLLVGIIPSVSLYMWYSYYSCLVCLSYVGGVSSVTLSQPRCLDSIHFCLSLLTFYCIRVIFPFCVLNGGWCVLCFIKRTLTVVWCEFIADRESVRVRFCLRSSWRLNCGTSMVIYDVRRVTRESVVVFW